MLDVFLGSGTTCVAAKELGYSYLGFEIDPKYYQISKDRLNGINQKGEMNLFYLQDEKLEQMNLFEGETDGNT